MVAPVNGPFAKYVDEWGYRETRTWSRQARPYNLVLGYYCNKAWTWHPENLGDPWRYAVWVVNCHNELHDAAYAKAYAKLVDQLGDTASLGINLAQWSQANDMISKRASQLTRFTVALARRSPVGVAASLGIRLKDATKIMRTRHGASKKLSDLWLEFWFGWKPLVSDIYSSCEVFQQDFEEKPLKSRGVVLSSKPKAQWTPDNWANSECIAFDKYRVGVQLGITTKVTNPNLHLMNQLGLLNPIAVLNDAVPWSFVLGWFSNVNSYLGSLTDFAGVQASNGYMTRYAVLEGHTVWKDYTVLGEPRPGKAVYVNRVGIGIPARPPLVFSLKRWMPTRGLTAISLLTQKLPRR